MAKNKKKQNNADKQKHLTAQHQNGFLNKLRITFKAATGEDVFQLFSSKELKLIIYCRASSISVVPRKVNQSLPKYLNRCSSYSIITLKQR